MEPDKRENTGFNNQEELLDLVDKCDQVIAVLPRSEVFARNTKNFRVVATFVINSQGLLWVPKSSTNKKRFALHWGMVGGCVSAGESYEDAFKREVKEEIGIDVNKVPYRYLGYSTPFTDGSAAFKKVYEITLDEITFYDTHEFSEYAWLRPEQLLQRIECGEKALPDLPMLIKKYYGK